MVSIKNEYKDLTELEKLKLLFYSELKKECKTFTIGGCSDQFLKGLENGIIAVAAKSYSKQKQTSKNKLN